MRYSLLRLAVQVSFSDLAMAEFAAVARSGSRPPSLPERLLGGRPGAVRAWRMMVLGWNAWRWKTTFARRRCVV